MFEYLFLRSCLDVLNSALNRLKQVEDEIHGLKDQYSSSGNVDLDSNYMTIELFNKNWKMLNRQIEAYFNRREKERTNLDRFFKKEIAIAKSRNENHKSIERAIYKMKYGIQARLDNFQFIFSSSLPQDCSEVQRNGNGKLVAICPSGSGEPFITNCVKDEKGNLWTVIQKRTGVKANFNRTWVEYEYGFRSTVDLWMGLKGVQRLTENRRHILGIHMKTIDGRILWAEYDNFTLTGPEYRLGLGNFKGNASDALGFNQGSRFGTFDRTWAANYPLIYLKGWWFSERNPGTYTDLNNQMIWFDTNLNEHLSISESQMVIRPWRKEKVEPEGSGESGDEGSGEFSGTSFGSDNLDFINLG